MKDILKKTILLLIALCIMITSASYNTSTVSAAAYKGAISKKMSLKPGEYVTLSFQLKKDTTVNITVKATDGKSRDFSVGSHDCPTCLDDAYVNEDCLAYTDSKDAGKLKQQLINDSGSHKIKLKKGYHNITIIASADGTSTQKLKAAIKAVNGKELLKIGKIEYLD